MSSLFRPSSQKIRKQQYQYILPGSSSSIRTNSATGYVGVYLNGKGYRARIRVDGKQENFGTYDTAKQAAKAFDDAAIELGIPVSKLNFPKKVPPGYIPKQQGPRSDNTSGFRGECNKRRRKDISSTDQAA